MADPAAVGSAVLAAMGAHQVPGLQPVEQLIAALAERPTLLVLDNCEHLLEPCAALTAALLAQHAAVNVLATAREPLGVPGEVTWRVHSLSAPPPETTLRCPPSGSTTPSDCSSIEPAGPARPSWCPTRTLRPSLRSATGSTASRSHWSWRPRAAGRCRRSGSRGARRPVPPPHGRCAHGASSTADAGGVGRLELRPVGRGRAGAVPSARSVRRELPDGRGGARRRGARRHRPGDGVRVVSRLVDKNLVLTEERPAATSTTACSKRCGRTRSSERVPPVSSGRSGMRR